ncbi:ADC synthase [Microdochium bolleyi]|uniref:ADC synthase n=1 Tax=Microdochium bolleyi TaxID=196109 RepID=A0A136J5Z5_9PEZI|nr:ADC synthase [Microdochium bolleyi]
MAAFQTSSTFKLTPGQFPLVDLAVKVLKNFDQRDYYAYERFGHWYIGLGSRSSLSIDPAGKTATTISSGKTTTRDIGGPISQVARDFVCDYGRVDGKAFGYASFNYAAHTRAQAYRPGTWPLLALFIPAVEICIGPEQVTIKGDDVLEIQALGEVLRSPVAAVRSQEQPSHVDITQNAEEYVARVANALSEIAAGLYEKVIPSRAVSVTEKIDILGTLQHGRPFNNPARSFAMSHAGHQAAGFSPELVMLSDHGRLTTEPLAGTRSREGNAAEIERLRQELLADPKEVVEHVISVREAVDELKRVCDPGSVVVEDFMSIRPRGSVQHLGSRVAGNLAPDKGAWDAFNVLFPSITASGIPKNEALEAIQRLEERPRELYSGAVLLLDGADFLEAALVLRTVFQDNSRRWLQAGAGVISQSNPEREFTETREKLASIAPFVVLDRSIPART